MIEGSVKSILVRERETNLYANSFAFHSHYTWHDILRMLAMNKNTLVWLAELFSLLAFIYSNVKMSSLQSHAYTYIQNIGLLLIQNTLHFIEFICSIRIRLSYSILFASFACEAKNTIKRCTRNKKKYIKWIRNGCFEDERKKSRAHTHPGNEIILFGPRCPPPPPTLCHPHIIYC